MREVKDDYIESLDRDQRAAWAFCIFLRQWLSSMCRSGAAQNWTLSELAILFEVAQAFYLTDQPHSQASLVRELGLPQQMVSRNVRRLQRMGIVRQEESPADARRKLVIPTDKFFTRDAMLRIADRFAKGWFHNWDQVDKAKGTQWYVPPSQCKDVTAKRESNRFRSLADVA